MTKYLLSLPGAEKLFLFSERFTQDPLENYFGQQRARCWRSDNPSVNQCLQNASALRIQKSAALDPIGGNCRRKWQLFESEDYVIDETPLPKRKRHSKK